MNTTKLAGVLAGFLAALFFSFFMAIVIDDYTTISAEDGYPSGFWNGVYSCAVGWIVYRIVTRCADKYGWRE